MKSAPFTYQRADTAAQAVGWLGEVLDEGLQIAKVYGGGQSLGPMLNLRLAAVDRLIDVSRVPGLRGFELRDRVLRIGSAVTHARIEDGELPDVTQGLLPRVAANIAYRAVRNRGTLGGSLAHADPKADWVSTMCLLDAAIVVLGREGERSVPASAFFLGPFTTALAEDEVIVAIEVPRFSSGARWAYRKQCRKPGEFASAIAGVWLDPARGVARALIGSLDSMPHVVEGEAALTALTRPGGIERVLDEAGVSDLADRAVKGVTLRRALAELDHL